MPTLQQGRRHQQSELALCNVCFGGPRRADRGVYWLQRIGGSATGIRTSRISKAGSRSSELPEIGPAPPMVPLHIANGRSPPPKWSPTRRSTSPNLLNFPRRNSSLPSGTMAADHRPKPHVESSTARAPRASREPDHVKGRPIADRSAHLGGG